MSSGGDYGLMYYINYSVFPFSASLLPLPFAGNASGSFTSLAAAHLFFQASNSL